MEQPTNYKYENQPTANTIIMGRPAAYKHEIQRYKYEKCYSCNKRRKTSDESHSMCHVCFKMKHLFRPSSSGNKAIDDFINHTQINCVYKEGKLEFVPYDRFTSVEFIAEGGSSKIYKANWIDGPVINYDMNIREPNYKNIRDKIKNIRKPDYKVVLKKLNNSKDVTSKELNELKVFYEFSLKWKAHRHKSRKTVDVHDPLYKYYIYGSYNYISKYFGITQDPITQDIMIIMQYYNSGDLTNYFITNNFYSISWVNKLRNLTKIIMGLINIHSTNIIHRDLHSGNIFFDKYSVVVIGDLGISKSAAESTVDDNNENYGIIPYMAPEIFHGRKHTTASDIYSFGMIMWEFMTGRRPFWNKIHNVDLIIEICDGLRPPIVTNAPEGYIDLMKRCWHPDPNKRPGATYVYDKIKKMHDEEWEDQHNPTIIIKSPDIGPVTYNNLGAIYKSRPLSGMIQSAMSTRSLRSQSINLENDLFRYYQKRNISCYDKRKFEDDQTEKSFINGKSIKKLKLIENENNNDYVTKELELDVDTNFKQYKNDYEYKTQEIDFDINIF